MVGAGSTNMYRFDLNKLTTMLEGLMMHRGAPKPVESPTTATVARGAASDGLDH